MPAHLRVGAPKALEIHVEPDAVEPLEQSGERVVSLLAQLVERHLDVPDLPVEDVRQDRCLLGAGWGVGGNLDTLPEEALPLLERKSDEGCEVGERDLLKPPRRRQRPGERPLLEVGEDGSRSMNETGATTVDGTSSRASLRSSSAFVSNRERPVRRSALATEL